MTWINSINDTGKGRRALLTQPDLAGLSDSLTLTSMYDAKRVERIRRGTSHEPDDRAARYLIDEIVKCCVRERKTETLGPRYDTLMTALETVCERRGISWSAEYSSLRAWTKAHDLTDVPSWERGSIAGEQFETLLDALDSETSLFEPIDEEWLDGWAAVDAEIDELRRDFAIADSASDYANLARQCREVFVSLADIAFLGSRHGPIPSGEQAPNVKPRLRAVIATEAQGAAQEELRGVALKTLDLANSLQHRKSTTRSEIATCCDATILTAAMVKRLVSNAD
jgi:hypothetical protein